MAATHPVRKALRSIGLDVHRVRQAPEPLAYLKTLGIRTVIDIGANAGQFAKEIRAMLPQAHIYSFEPLPDCYEELRTQMRSDPAFDAYNIALGDSAGSIEMHRSSYSLSSSLLPMADLHRQLFPHTQGERMQTVEMKRLDDVFEGRTLEEGILVKVDVQGYEDKVIAGGKETFGKASAALLEASFVPLYEDQPLFDDIYERMRALGFSYHGAVHQKLHKETGEVLFEDALFLR